MDPSPMIEWLHLKRSFLSQFLISSHAIMMIYLNQSIKSKTKYWHNSRMPTLCSKIKVITNQLHKALLLLFFNNVLSFRAMYLTIHLNSTVQNTFLYKTNEQ